MANLFRRIYDWLLRLFWYAHPPICLFPHAQASLPDALFDNAISSTTAREKSKFVVDGDRTRLLTASTI
jgi:hypothetical protein